MFLLFAGSERNARVQTARSLTRGNVDSNRVFVDVTHQHNVSRPALPPTWSDCIGRHHTDNLELLTLLSASLTWLEFNQRTTINKTCQCKSKYKKELSCARTSCKLDHHL